jgi:hypothetical protein
MTKTSINHEAADYILEQGSDAIVLNDSGHGLCVEYNTTRAAYAALECGAAGALIVSIFVERPWLLAMAINLSASDEYDDEGGTYRSITTRITDVHCLAGQGQGDGGIGDPMSPDGETAADEIEEALSSESTCLYRAFASDDGDLSTFSMRVERHAIAELIEQFPVSGKTAFAALFPAHADKVRIDR